MPATTVAAQGTAETKYNLVTFHVSLSEEGTNVPTAKARLTLAVDGLNESLDAVRQSLGLEFVKNSVRTSSSTQENWEWVGKNRDKRELQGFTMSYSLSFDIDDLDQVSKVYDALTSIPKITVHQPAFSLKLKNREKLNKKALQAAWKKVEERFAMECETLRLDPANFEIASWEATYSDSRRSDRVAKGVRSFAMAASAPVGGAARGMPESDEVEGAAMDAEPTIGFTVGLASVTANLEVGYARKAQ